MCERGNAFSSASFDLGMQAFAFYVNTQVME
jgi:hypothetical protein